MILRSDKPLEGNQRKFVEWVLTSIIPDIQIVPRGKEYFEATFSGDDKGMESFFETLVRKSEKLHIPPEDASINTPKYLQ